MVMPRPRLLASAVGVCRIWRNSELRCVVLLAGILADPFSIATAANCPWPALTAASGDLVAVRV